MPGPWLGGRPGGGLARGRPRPPADPCATAPNCSRAPSDPAVVVHSASSQPPGSSTPDAVAAPATLRCAGWSAGPAAPSSAIAPTVSRHPEPVSLGGLAGRPPIPAVSDHTGSLTRPSARYSSAQNGATNSSAVRQPSPAASAPPTASGAAMPTNAATAFASVMAAGPRTRGPWARASAACTAMQRKAPEDTADGGRRKRYRQSRERHRTGPPSRLQSDQAPATPPGGSCRRGGCSRGALRPPSGDADGVAGAVQARPPLPRGGGRP